MIPSAPSSRRQWLAYASASLAGTALLHAPALALPARTLSFPRDHGSHPELRTEWWYITGHALAQQRLWGFQITFFRSRVDATQTMRSAFAAKQLIFAHAALTDVQGHQQLHDQRMARAGFGIAEAAENDTQVRLRNCRPMCPEKSARHDAATRHANLGSRLIPQKHYVRQDRDEKHSEYLLAYC